MSKFSNLLVVVLVLVLACIASCGGGSSDTDLFSSASLDEPASAGPAGLDPEGLPAIPLDEAGDEDRSASWLSTVDPTTPLLEWRTAICGVDPSCLILQGLHGLYFTHVPKPPYFSYALYKAPLGASEADLQTLKLTGHMAAAGEQYYIGIANYSAMAWDWFGPAGAVPDYSIDIPSLGYDFTSPAGAMYFVVIVPQANTLHLEDITLDFADPASGGGGPGAPDMWNVWGQAFVNVTTGVGLPGAHIEFEDLGTGIFYNLIADGNGNWGTNLPTGNYRFRVYANTVLYDMAAATPIQTFDITLDLAAGQFTYHGSNLVYDGTVVPMPLITTDVY